MSVSRLLLIPILALGLGACSQEPSKIEAGPRPVRIGTVGQAKGEGIALPGTLAAWESVEASFEVPGRIIELKVGEGDEVTKGQLLAKLDDRDYQSQLEGANAKLAQAEAEYKRTKQLFDNQVVPQAEMDKVVAARDVAKSQVDQATKAVDDCLLRAPFDGVVARRFVEVSTSVQAKQTVLLVNNVERLKMDVDLPEAIFAMAKPGLSLEERNRLVKPTVTVSAFPGRSWPAELVEIATQADPKTRTYRCTVAFDTPDDAMLLPGMTASVRGSKSGVSGIMAVPVTALVAKDSGEPAVWVVDPQTMAVSRRPVTIGSVSGDKIEVTEGLQSGDQVVETGTVHMREGLVVKALGGDAP